MNFIEAAIKLLKESRKTMSAEELAELAVERKLLSRPGKNPVRSMKTQLSTEANKGDDSRITRVGEDRWKLPKSAAESKAKTERTQKTAKTAKATTKATAKKAAPKATKKTAAKTGQAGKKATAKNAAAKTEQAEQAPETKAKKTTKATAKATTKKTAKKATKKVTAQADKAAPAAEKAEAKTEPAKATAQKATKKAAQKATKAAAKAKKAAAAQAETAARKGGKRAKAAKAEQKSPAADEPRSAVEEVVGEPSPELADVLAPKQQVRRAAPAETPDEDAIEELYGDELSGTEPGAAFAEYRDAQTEDEDRPMVPEIVSNRRERHRRERRRRSEQRRTRREQRAAARDNQREAPGKEAQAQEAKPEAKPETKPETKREVKREVRETREVERRAAVEAAPPAPAEVSPQAPEALDFYRPGNVLADAAVEVLSSFKNGQPVHVEQLARMMRKRQLITDDPAQVWPHLKAALLNDEQRFRDRGLRPRVIYGGRDMFAPGPAAPSAALADAELALSETVDGLTAAVHATLKARLSTLDAGALERLAHVYLLRSGWRNVQWIKRVERSSYAVGEPPGGMGSVLVGVRAGDQPVDRRGVGELRAGVAYKNLDSGLLLAPQDLSDIARKELSRGGRSVAALVGDAFVAALIRSGIGVLAKQVPVLYFDDNYFDELEEAR